MANLILLSGPSCVGKSPLFQSFKRLFPEKSERIEKIVLYNDRIQRPGEREGYDYHFRSRAEIEALRTRDNYLVIPVRNDLQALELDSIQRILDRGCHAFYEGAPYVVSALLERQIAAKIPTTAIFLSPLGKEEILFFRDPKRSVDLPALVTDVMRKKLLRRKQKQMGLLSAPDLEDIEIRCRAAFGEMCEAYKFEYVIPNHDGEDSDHWALFPFPMGDALHSVLDFVSILDGHPRSRIERWTHDLLSFDPRIEKK